MANSQISLITGANKGIGFEIATALGKQGHTVLLAGRNAVATNEAVAILSAQGIEAFCLSMDITSDDSIQKAVCVVENMFGKIDILINNAAIRVEEYGKSPSEQSLTQWLETFDTNLFGTVNATCHFLPLLKRSTKGKILNVSSLLGSVTLHSDTSSYTYTDAFKSLPAYSASKTALNSWTAHLAYELRDTPITVNSIHPGYTKTDLNDGDGTLTPKEGALTAIQVALDKDNSVSGQFIHMGSVLPW
ncbi:SDR family oxidoreductase [Vibrio crassostreae]|uniref:2-hydroxycyclohexanecarboxyl-CoA dehydrogenase n=1 Tax=Vibrio crassostreae TaxID=246167 RepID=A0ABP1WX54_9VIBR|nr:SDR family oxidoreductase [Vibrio crassostreae]TCL30381.1 NAD(P)-dependent dehydrogenase (short-subunit alcohol dehydrogenase family) [Vibrio crassostreae]TCT53484.1 NAD(P)-dependent dehydrogenase (short-subunit alcohol dehydrogenase family) [Vibrio crassostreae]TCT57771.1 NAD(P)-dependent dehydrogenase (short-subunit alcohol dehydrogenase family) [Vibrio crassostreae]CAK1862602.1 SDR family oxidoreductase [Vibrio crassostreae]CAK1863875.1 SDR family oxidoreductase [Vibrio crassostreae]